MPQRLVLMCAFALIAVLAFVFHATEVLDAPQQDAVLSPGNDVVFEIANTPEARAQGLSGRSEIPHDYAMFFVFPEAGKHGIWMKDMLVPIDILWVEKDGTVIGVEENVSPNTYPRVFYPLSSVPYVLETRAGEAERLGWEIGSTISLPVL